MANEYLVDTVLFDMVARYFGPALAVVAVTIDTMGMVVGSA